MIGEILVVLGLAIIITAVGIGWVKILIECLVTEDYTWFAFFIGIGLFIIGIMTLCIT